MTSILTLLNRFENAAGVYERSDDPAARDELHAARRAIVERDAELVKALRNVQKLISEAAMTGFNWKDGNWAERLYLSQQVTSRALRTTP